jgi:hypothetical protein
LLSTLHSTEAVRPRAPRDHGNTEPRLVGCSEVTPAQLLKTHRQQSNLSVTSCAFFFPTLNDPAHINNFDTPRDSRGETTSSFITSIVATGTHLDFCDTNTISRHQLLHSHTMPAIDRLRWQDLPASFDQSKQSPSAASTDDETTGFFTLPREIRDSIYDFMYLEGEQKPDGLNKAQIIEGSDFGFIVHTRTPVPQARLVSRRFNSEYEERPASANRAQLTSNEMPQCWDLTPGPTISSQCTELELDFHYPRQIEIFGPCVWCQGTQYIAYMSLRRLNFLVDGKPLLKLINIRLHCSGSDLGCDGLTKLYA